MEFHRAIQYGSYILLFSLLIAGLTLIFKSRIRKKRLCSVLLAILFFVLFLLSSFMPIEEPFLTFPTVEEAFHYEYDCDILLTVEGSESTQVVCDLGHGSGYHSVVLPKTDKGWKPGISLDTKPVETKFTHNGTTILLQRYKQTDDFYLTVVSLVGMDELFDNRNTEFQSITGSSFSGNEIPPGRYYAFLDGVDENYVLTIDGEEYTFPKAK